MTEINYLENRKNARIAGIWYLAFVILGATGMLCTDAAYSLKNNETGILICENELLFRFGLVACFAGYVCFLFLANKLYDLFKSVNSSLGRLMLIFVGVGVSIAILNRLNQIMAFLEFNNAYYQDVGGYFLDIFKYGEMLATIFWGLWLFPLACLILKSDFIPKIIGILLIATGCCHIIEFLIFFLCRNYLTFIQSIFYIIEMIGEFSFILWLLIKGIKKQKTAQIR
jgi:hypothetical protein